MGREDTYMPNSGNSITNKAMYINFAMNKPNPTPIIIFMYNIRISNFGAESMNRLAIKARIIKKCTIMYTESITFRVEERKLAIFD
jgi:hypothetical protein